MQRIWSRHGMRKILRTVPQTRLLSVGSCGRLRKPCLKRHPARHVLREVPRNRPSDSLETALPKGASMKLAAKGAYAAWLTEGSESRTANGDFRGQSYGRFRESDYIQVTLRSNIRTTPKNKTTKRGLCGTAYGRLRELCRKYTRAPDYVRVCNMRSSHSP